MELGRFWWWVVLILVQFGMNGCFGCWEQEKAALLQLKASINSTADIDYLQTWNSTNKKSDCCNWERVKCDNTTGRVIQLDLNYTISWSRKDWCLNASLFLPFEELQFLNLDGNYISRWVPNEGFERFSVLRKLEMLNLAHNHFNNNILSSLSGISLLKITDLSKNKLFGSFHIPDKNSNIPNLGLVNQKDLDKILRSEVFVHTDGQLRAAHLILQYTPISTAFQAPKCVIKARDPRLRQISVAAPGFLLPGPIPGETLTTTAILDGIPKKSEASQASHSSTSEDSSSSEDGFEAFGRDSSIEDLTLDPFPQPSEAQDDMGIQRKARSSLLELIEGQPGRADPPKTAQVKPPSLPPVVPPPIQALGLHPAELKRKRESKGKEPMEVGRVMPAHEDESQKMSKHPRTGHKEMERRSSPSTAPEAWLPAPMLDGAPLPATASIRDYQGGKGGYVADAVEQALLLPGDMAELRNLRRHEVFLALKRYLGMAVQASFRTEEMVNYCHRQMKEEEAKRHDADDRLKAAEESLQDTKKKLTEEERGKKSATAALENAERQAESQRLLLRRAEDDLAASKAQVLALQKKLAETEAAREEAEKARDQAEQEGYDVGVAETEEALRAEVSGVCRTYCRQVWLEALNQAGVEASSALRKAESVYYPAAIRPSLPSLLRTGPVPVKAEAGEVKTTTASAPSEEGSEPERVIESRPSMKASDPPIVIPDDNTEKDAGKGLELVLVSHPLPAPNVQVGREQETSDAAEAQVDPPPPKEKK